MTAKEGKSCLAQFQATNILQPRFGFRTPLCNCGPITSFRNSYVEVPIPGASECGCLETGSVKEVLRVNSSPIWLALLYKKEMWMQTGMKTQNDGGHRQDQDQILPSGSTQETSLPTP
jgi:hypothetical protein